MFVTSGAAGLIDQVCFSKYLSYVMGATAGAISAVLAAFMAGMALGARVGGAFAARVKSPLIAYGVLEILVGLSVAAAPFAFDALPGLYLTLLEALPGSPLVLAALRWMLAVSFVIVPTVAMGATLPLLSRLTEGYGDTSARERALGVLYAANTLGGAAGSLACVYVVLPSLGLSRSTLGSAALSALVGVLAILLGRSRGERLALSAKKDERTSEPSAKVPHVWSLVAAASGALVFASEVVFVHLLVLMVGTSAYAFGVILSIFLVCLFLGAALAPAVHARFGRRALPLGLASAALALMLTMPVWEMIPEIFPRLGPRVTSFEGREALRGLAAFAALVVPTTLMGLSFPLLLQSVAARPDVGRLVGRLTAINTVGSVLGSLAAGYLLLPELGSQRSLSTITLAFALAAAATAMGTEMDAKHRRPAFLASALSMLGTFLTPRWDLVKMTGGYNVYFDWGRGEETILWVHEDTEGGVTTVTLKDGVRTLLTNGKFQGNDGMELEAQRGCAHYPAMFVRNFDRALVVGLGTGTTLGTIASYPFKEIEAVEISPAIVEASRSFFGHVGGSSLDDPRVKLFVQDGRNHLFTREQTFDFIGMELSSVWFMGSGNLYSQEFYRLVKTRLRPGAIFQQWIQLHHIYPRDIAVVMHTLRLSFPHVALFFGGGQGILVASETPLTVSYAHTVELEKLRGEHAPHRPYLDLLGDVLLTTEGIDAFIADVAREGNEPIDALLSTDDNLYLEYATPRGNVLPWSSRVDLLERMAPFRSAEAVQAMVAD